MGGLGLGATSGGGNFFGQGSGGPTLLALPSNINEEDAGESSKNDAIRNSLPLPPNEFQKYRCRTYYCYP